MSKSINYENLKDNYFLLWNTMIVNQNKQTSINNVVRRIKNNILVYEKIIEQIPNIPWQFIGLTHLRECNLSLGHHLHNGDTLTARTVHVPAGRPVNGKPPFTFVESAVDALKLERLDKETDWSITNVLYKLESYNGFGYMNRGINSPYLWAGSNHYIKGKYIADKKFDKDYVDTQLGCALVLKSIWP